MTITGLEEMSSSRSKVYIDNEFAFVLYKGELRLYKIRVGEEIAENIYKEIMEKILPKRAKLRAMSLLTSKEYTTAKLREKLRQGFYPPIVIDEALAYVASFHYIDDYRYASDYIRQTISSRSRRRIEQDLMKKGVPGDCIAKAFADYEELEGKNDEMGLMKSLLEKRHYDPETADFKDKQREFAYLCRKGFQPEQVRKALDIMSFTS